MLVRTAAAGAARASHARLCARWAWVGCGVRRSASSMKCRGSRARARLVGDGGDVGEVGEVADAEAERLDAAVPDAEAAGRRWVRRRRRSRRGRRSGGGRGSAGRGCRPAGRRRRRSGTSGARRCRRRPRPAGGRGGSAPRCAGRRCRAGGRRAGGCRRRRRAGRCRRRGAATAGPGWCRPARGWCPRRWCARRPSSSGCGGSRVGRVAVAPVAADARDAGGGAAAEDGGGVRRRGPSLAQACRKARRLPFGGNCADGGLNPP